ncbi:MAG TPA: hypothetical protein VF607_17000 [Verrucomicrobiae bacterium]
MYGLTKLEIKVLTVIAVLLLTGWVVKVYRASHNAPPEMTAVAK